MNVGGIDLKIALSQLKHREREAHGENVQRHIRVPCFDVFVRVVEDGVLYRLRQRSASRFQVPE